MAKRPNQIQFYANGATQEILRSVDTGERSDYINKAIALYHERLAGGRYYPLEKAYEYLKYVPSPEAEPVLTALRSILWRRADLPTSVKGRIIFDDGSSSVEHFSDAEKAMMLAMQNPRCVRYEIYDRLGTAVAIGSRSDNGAFVMEKISPELLP